MLIDAEKAINEAFDVMIDGNIVRVVQVETLMGLSTIEPKCGKMIVEFTKDELQTIKEIAEAELFDISQACRDTSIKAIIDLVHVYEKIMETSKGQ